MGRSNGVILSIIIPAYNCAETIERAVDSIQENVVGDTEILVIENGSTDDTNCRIEKLLKRYSNIRYYRSKNGVYNARNMGIEKSIGEFIMFLDADDEILCKICIADLTKDGSDIAIFGRAHYLGCKIDKIWTHSKSEILNVDSLSREFKHIFNENILSCCTAKIYKSSIIKKNRIRFPPVETYEDLLFVLLYVSCIKSIGLYEKIIYKQNDTEGSLSKRIKKNYESQVEYVIKSLKSLYKKLHIDDSTFVNNQVIYLVSLIDRNQILKDGRVLGISSEYINNEIKFGYRDLSFKYYIICKLHKLKMYRILTLIESMRI